MCVIQLTNYGIEASLMDAVMNVSREAFRQSYCSYLIDGRRQLEHYGK